MRRHDGRMLGPVVAEIAQAHRPLVEALVARRHHAALAAGRDLVVLEAEGGNIAPGADLPAAIARAQGLRAVLQHKDAPAVGLEHNAVHVRRHPLIMHDQHRPRARGGQPDEFGGVQVERLVNLGQHGLRAHAHDGREAGHPAPGREDHLVAGSDAHRRHRHLERAGAAAHAEGVVGADVFAELLFQLHHHGRRRLEGRAIVAEGLLAAEHIKDEGLFLGADDSGAQAGRGTGTKCSGHYRGFFRNPLPVASAQ